MVVDEMKKQQKQIKEHESEYFHIKKTAFNLIWKIPLAIIPFVLSYLMLVYGIIGNWAFLKLPELFAEEAKNAVFSNCNLLIIPMLILECFLIAGSFMFAMYLIKGKLKSYEDEGLILGLIFGLIVGLILGLIGGLIFGLIGVLIFGLILGLIGGLIVGLIWGLIMGLIGGLIVGLIMGLFWGLIEEFKR